MPAPQRKTDAAQPSCPPLMDGVACGADLTAYQPWRALEDALRDAYAEAYR